MRERNGGLMEDMISRKAAIDALNCWDSGKLYLPIDFRDLILSLPSAQPEPCEDTISRQAAISVIAKWMLEYGGEGEERERNALKQAAEEIKDLPPTQPEIIRCKDCKLHGTNGYRLNCAMFCCTMPDDGFCSCGERRTDG